VDGRHVVTRPGSFGGVDSLRDIVTELQSVPPADQEGTMTATAASTDARPLVAVTMGDGAGVGPS
jgi:4-hydroxythreonine-4-phosphate dehydrogenase